MPKLSKIDALKVLAKEKDAINVDGVKITPRQAQQLINLYGLMDKDLKKVFERKSVKEMLDFLKKVAQNVKEHKK